MLLLSQGKINIGRGISRVKILSDRDAVGDADRLLGWSAIRCGLFADVATIGFYHDEPTMLSYQERVDDTLLGHLPDLSLTEVDGAKLINASGEELFWRYGAFPAPSGFARLICCRARKTVSSPA